jgi:hypothetical protein
MRSHRAFLAAALGLVLLGLSSAPASANVVLTLSPAGPTTVAPGSDELLSLMIHTDAAFTLDNLTVDLSPFGIPSGDPGSTPKAGFGGFGSGFSDAFATNLFAGIPLAANSDTTFNSFFDVFVDLTTPPGTFITADAKIDLTSAGLGTVQSNNAVFVTPRQAAPEPATLTLVAVGGLVSLYAGLRRRRPESE